MPDDSSRSIEILSRREVFRNSKFLVCADHIISQNGVDVEDYLSVFPLTASLDGITGVAILPVVDEKLVFLRVARHPLGAEWLEIPRGFVDEEESPLEAAMRELQEETGLGADVHSFVPLGTISPEPAMVRGTIAIFLAKNCAFREKSCHEEFGHLGIQTLTLFEVERLLDQDSFGDPSTVVALLKYLRMK